MATRAADRTMFGEVGVAGNLGYWGWPDSGEHIRSLEGRLGRIEYDKMRRSDHQVRAVLSAITLPIRQADYYVEPGSKSEGDMQIAKILEDALLREMTITWDDTIRHALLMLPFGFSPLEKVYEERAGLILPKKLDPRLPRSVHRWQFDQDKRRLTHMVQLDSMGQEHPIPIEKLVIFSTDREGDNWEGMSILRPAYKSWYIKDKLERINGIMHDRWGAGIPSLTPPKGVARGSTEWNAGVELLEQLHAGEKGYVIKPEGWAFEVLGGQKGQGTDVLASIKYYDESIAKAMLAMHINLGTAEKGSRALGASFIDAFLMATQAWADYIAEVIDRFVVRELVDLNWSVKEYPHLKVRRIPGLNLDALGFLAQSGLVNNDAELENSLRDVLRLPHREEKSKTKPPADSAPADDEEPEPDEPAPGEQAAAEQLAAIARKQAAAIAEQLAAGALAHTLRIPAKAEMADVLRQHRRRRFGPGPDLLGEEISLDIESATDAMAIALTARAVDLKRRGAAGGELLEQLHAAARPLTSAGAWLWIIRGAVKRGGI